MAISLHKAFKAGKVSATERLISEGADVNAKEWNHETPLHAAPSRCHGGQE